MMSPTASEFEMPVLELDGPPPPSNESTAELVVAMSVSSFARIVHVEEN